MAKFCEVLAYISAFLIPCGVASGALAADAGAADDCGLKAAVWGGYSYSELKVDEFPDDGFNAHGPMAVAAGLLSCGTWNAQVDLEGSATFNESEPEGKILSGGATGKLFWRDTDIGAVGALAGYDFSSLDYEDPDFRPRDIHEHDLSAGVFGQYFATDRITVAASAGVDWQREYDDNFAFDDAIKSSGWNVQAAAKFYVDPRFALVVQARYAESDIEEGAILTEDITLGGGAEYLIENTGLSLFGRAQVGFSSIGFERDEEPGYSWIDATVLTAFAGIRYDFGPVPSLVERDRTGPISLSLLP